MAEWTRDLLASRGSLVETGPGDVIRALLPAEAAARLGTGEWLSLDLDAGAEDAHEWLDRLARLLPEGRRVAAARLRRAGAAPRIDVDGVLAREFPVQNGICRLLEDFPATASYCLFTFEYVVESDDRNSGFVTLCLNTSARSGADHPAALLRTIQDDLDEEPDGAANEAWKRVYPFAVARARAEVLKTTSGLVETANRRLARDTERVITYYEGLLAQIAKRAQKKVGDQAAMERERSRARATAMDREAKLEDLVRKYSLRVQVELTDILQVTLPVRVIAVRLARKKQERNIELHWNTVLRELDIPLCERCGGQPHPLYLCEDVHLLCGSCYLPCERCGRTLCRLCRSECRCVGSDPSPGAS